MDVQKSAIVAAIMMPVETAPTADQVIRGDGEFLSLRAQTWGELKDV